jgi:L-lactate dehydrogenase
VEHPAHAGSQRRINRPHIPQPMKVAVVGTGMVGTHAAYALVLTRNAREIVLVDLNRAAAQAHAEDILHATPFAAPARVYAGGYDELAGSDVVLLCCGVGQRPGESRLQLLERNVAVFRTVLTEVLRNAPNAILVVASNPVDIMTEVTRQIAGLPEGRVLGSGTLLDSARFRTLIADHLGVSPLSVHGYVLGEHGDSEVLAWSTVSIGGIPLPHFAQQSGRVFDDAVRARIDAGVRKAAYRIIAGKGYTAQGIGAALARIVRVIRDDERAVLPLSGPAVIAGQQTCLSLPRQLGRNGIGPAVMPQLPPDESDALGRSAQLLRETTASIA